MSIEEIFAKVFSVPPQSVTDDVRIRDFTAWDSMSHMHLIFQLEESFGVQLTGDQIADMVTVSDARRFLRQQGAAL
jgi:acyl carrier protein